VTGNERRTTALRGPGAGGFTPPQSLAASNPCLNCGTNIQLTYCPECGQAEIDSDPTLREFLRELAEELIHWDGKLSKTFRLLVTRPGELTREYVAGKRVRYISPLRVYLTCSLVFFFVSAIATRQRNDVQKGAAISARIGPFSIVEADSDKTIAALDTLANHGRWVGRVWGRHFANARRNRGAFSADILSSVPKTMFVLVPLFAALVMFAFRGKRLRFPQHLAFALHVHAFLFLALTIMKASRFTTVVPVQVALQLVCLGAIAVYLVRSTRTVYGVGTGAAIARSALVASTYFLLFCVAMLLTFGLIVLLQF
jgi:hypothetical protein